MNNGVVIAGHFEDYKAKIKGQKIVKDDAGKQITPIKAFPFNIKDDKGEVIATASNDQDGYFDHFEKRTRIRSIKFVL